jgi:hypothetical protein
MDSHIDTHTGVIIPVSTTAYGLLLHKDRFADKGQTRVKHHEKRRKTPEIFGLSRRPLEGTRTLGWFPDPWRVPYFYK